MQVLTVDYQAPTACDDFVKSLREIGFAVIKNHPVPVDLIFNAYKDWEDFFANEEKFAYTFDHRVQAGYFPFKSENAKGYPVKDLKEFYHYYKWFGLPKSLSNRTGMLYDLLERIACQLLAWIERGSPEDIQALYPMPLSNMVAGSRCSLLRILHYPPLTEEDNSQAIRAAGHEDINLLTILPSATQPGLEILDLEGNWHKIACNPAQLVVNAGDMLQMMTRGYFRSTTHRVSNPEEEEMRKARLSMSLFLHPHDGTKLIPEMTSDQYLRERLNEIGLIPDQQKSKQLQR